MLNYEEKIAELEKELKAKNRELAIEAALERVRIKSIAMHRTSELQEVVNLVAQELHKMEMDITGVFMVINNNEIDKQFSFWGSTGVAEKYVKKAAIPFLDRPIYSVLSEGTIKGERFFTEEYSREEKIEFFQHMFKFPPYSLSSDEWKEQVLSREGGYTRSVSVSRYTSIFVVNHFGRKLSDADNKILQRFGRVFEQSYIRFLDLQKAEAQAKEAVKQASLDRVRAEIASMRTAEDLKHITPLIWRELKTLEVPFIRCGVSIIDEANENIRLYLTTPEGNALGALNLPFAANYLTLKTVDYWKKGVVYKEYWDKQAFINWTKAMTELGQVQNAETYQGSSNPPEALYLHFVPFAQGMLYVGDISPLADDKIQLVKTLARAFSIAYARYEDFKTLEEAKNKIEITVNELEAAQEKLKELDQLKSQFFANISHEFRTPLTLILGQIDSVCSSNVDIKEKEKLLVANRNAKRLLSLINQLLDLSRLESGTMELKAGQHNLVSFLKVLFYAFESIAGAKNIALDFKSDFEDMPVVFDPDKMEKIFYNIISNAFKFTPAGGKIKVHLCIINDSLVEVRIKDSGMGIKKDQLPYVFDRFYQIDGSAVREQEGTGIGLSLTKELVALHNGSITADSELGKWTEFIMHFPLGSRLSEKHSIREMPEEEFSFRDDINESEMIQTQYPPAEKDMNSAEKEIILIVEDNAEVRSYIREQIKSSYQVIEVPNGEEGILKAREEIPDLIITDVMMPKMDGYTFSKEIRQDEKTSHIPIIMLTAKATLDDKIKGLETGIDAYITKPFSARELLVRIRNLTAQREQLRKRFSTATIIKPSEVSVDSVDRVFLQKVIGTIELNFDNDKFGLEQLAAEVNMSTSQLSRKLNALIDQPAGQLIRSLRLQRAADLIEQNGGTIAEICYQVGFNDQAYFSKVFKKQFGCTPSAFRNK